MLNRVPFVPAVAAAWLLGTDPGRAVAVDFFGRFAQVSVSVAQALSGQPVDWSAAGSAALYVFLAAPAALLFTVACDGLVKAVAGFVWAAVLRKRATAETDSTGTGT